MNNEELNELAKKWGAAAREHVIELTKDAGVTPVFPGIILN